MSRLEDAARRLGVALHGEIGATRWSNVGFGEWRGQPVIVKVRNDISDERRAAALLAAWRDGPVACVLATSDDALVVERVLPGNSLESRYDMLGDDGSLDVLADVAAALRALDASALALPDATERGASLLTGTCPGAIDAALWDPARRDYRELAASQRVVGVVHGDLHHANVVFDAQRGWLAIDPKGMRAELEFEMACALRNPIARVAQWAEPDVMTRRSARMAARLDLDAARLARWCFAQAVLAAAWAVEDSEDPEPWLRVARACPAGSI